MKGEARRIAARFPPLSRGGRVVRAKRERVRVFTYLNPSVALINASVFPASNAECPASGVT